MSDMKTVANDGDVAAFLNGISHDRRREDCQRVVAMMEQVTRMPPVMWGDSIIGFGSYGYARADGSRHSFFRTGTSPRKQALTVYIMPGFKPYADLLAQLGPHKHSSSCLYITNLAKVDFDVLTELVKRSLEEMDRRYPA